MKKNYDEIIKEAKILFEKVISMLTNEKHLNVIDSYFQKSRQNINIIKIKEEFDSVIENLLSKLEERYSEYNATDIYREIYYLEPKNFKSRLDSSSKKLQEISFSNLSEKINVKNIVIQKQYQKFVKEYYQHLLKRNSFSFLKKVLPDNEITENNPKDSQDLSIMVYCDDVWDENQADDQKLDELGENYIKVQSIPKICYCLECVLQYLHQEKKGCYDELLKLYRYICTIPTTEVKCERDFSKMKLTKNRLR